MTYYHLQPFIYTKNHFFQCHKMSFSALMASIGQQVLTKRSTHVDQNIRSDKVMSQLSITIFVAPRTHLVAQKTLISSKKSKKPVNPGHPPCSLKRAIYKIYIKNRLSKHICYQV